MEKLEPCPFCKGKAHIVPCDDEGNLHYEDGYEQNPWSGIGYLIVHDSGENPDCPIAHEPGDSFYGNGKIYETPEQAAAAWNRRNTERESIPQPVMKMILAEWPVRPKMIKMGDEAFFVCEICGGELKQPFPAYCPHCGQRI